MFSVECSSCKYVSVYQSPSHSIDAGELGNVNSPPFEIEDPDNEFDASDIQPGSITSLENIYLL